MIVENILRLKEEIPKEVKLIAISKTKPTSDIIKAYNSGHIYFGENKIQEMGIKFEKLPKDIKWHMVGHVQSNKIKYMASYVDLVHGIDSLKSLKVLNKEGEKNKRVIEPTWLRLKVYSNRKDQYLSIISRGKSANVGSFLNLKELSELAKTIKSALIKRENHLTFDM